MFPSSLQQRGIPRCQFRTRPAVPSVLCLKLRCSSLLVQLILQKKPRHQSHLHSRSPRSSRDVSQSDVWPRALPRRWQSRASPRAWLRLAVYRHARLLVLGVYRPIKRSNSTRCACRRHPSTMLAGKIQQALQRPSRLFRFVSSLACPLRVVARWCHVVHDFRSRPRCKMRFILFVSAFFESPLTYFHFLYLFLNYTMSIFFVHYLLSCLRYLLLIIFDSVTPPVSTYFVDRGRVCRR